VGELGTHRGVGKNYLYFVFADPLFTTSIIEALYDGVWI